MESKLLVFAYASAFRTAAEELLELVRPILSEVEKKYVDELGPKIVAKRRFHDEVTRLGGCTEGREASRDARKLEVEAKVLLDGAGISAARQELLEELLFSSDKKFLESSPPKDMSHIEHHIRMTSEKGKLALMRELANSLDPYGFTIGVTIKFLSAIDTEYQILLEADKSKKRWSDGILSWLKRRRQKGILSGLNFA